jgi:hypothetical protein
VGRALAPKFPSYRGPVDDKTETLRTYKFTIAFENAQHFPGYITADKIFDPMQAGSIPIYWGAPNITEYVPQNCFIAFKDFDYSWEKLYPYLLALPREEHIKYIKNIKHFMEKVAPTGPHSDQVFVQTLLTHTLDQ